MFHAVFYNECQLCYSINNDTILIPDLLSVQEPILDFDFENLNCIVVDYDKYLPHSIFPRFIIQAKNDVKDHYLWRTGVVLKNYRQSKNNEYIIFVNYQENNISIYFESNIYDAYLNIFILRIFESINSSYEKLEVDYKILIKHTKQLISIGDLKNKSKDHFKTYLPEGSNLVFNLRKLLMIVDAFDEDDKMEKIVKKQPLFHKYKTESDILSFKNKLNRIEKRYLIRHWHLYQLWKKTERLYKILLILFAITAGILGIYQLIILIPHRNQNQESEKKIDQVKELKLKENNSK